MLERFEKLNITEAWDFFTDICKDPEKTQQEVLHSILRNAGGSSFAKKYEFADIADFDDYRSRVPVSEWDDYSDISLEMQNGKSDVLFKGQPSAFIITSGTSGTRKLIPETDLGSKAKSVTDSLRRCFTFGAHPEIMKGKVLPLVNRADLGVTSSGIPFGTASGLTMMSAPAALLKTCAFPPAVLKISDPDSMDYVLMRFALTEDVRMIIGNNIARMEKLANVAKKYAVLLCDDIANGTLNSDLKILSDVREELADYLSPEPERAETLRQILNSEEEFTPRVYWPELKVISCWLSGTVGASVESTKKLFGGGVTYLDYGYGASEGKFNIPHNPGVSAGTLALHAAFYEFVPVSKDTDSCQDDSVTLLAHELKEGGLYRMIITTFSGLYRYDMHDMVRVESFYENTPEIVFVSKTGDIGNIAGEKLAGSTISSAAASVAENIGFRVKHICAVTVEAPPHYIFCIEADGEVFNDPAELAGLLDDEIRKDIGYKNRRRDRLLVEPEVRIMKKGWQEAIYLEKTAEGLSRAQVKLPVIYDEIPQSSWEC